MVIPCGSTSKSREQDTEDKGGHGGRLNLVTSCWTCQEKESMKGFTKRHLQVCVQFKAPLVR